MSITRVVAITGCDSGLGWSLAARSAREGLVTVAGMFGGTDTNASKALKNLSAHTCQLDVTSVDSVNGFRDYVKSVVDTNPGYRLHAVVNNSGIMTIGEYEWQTRSMIESAINVNLVGAMRVASAFLPDLRTSALICPEKVKPRLVNIASHCGLHALPGFAPYSASKAGVMAWTRALRMEQKPHGLGVVAFLPGGFVGASNLLSEQVSRGTLMLENLNEEQKQFYEKRIKSLMEYLGAGSTNTNFDSMKDENIIETFMQALLQENPKELYVVENIRYKLYYSLMRLPLPENLHHWLVKQFLCFPNP